MRREQLRPRAALRNGVSGMKRNNANASWSQRWAECVTVCMKSESSLGLKDPLNTSLPPLSPECSPHPSPLPGSIPAHSQPLSPLPCIRPAPAPAPSPPSDTQTYSSPLRSTRGTPYFRGTVDDLIPIWLHVRRQPRAVVVSAVAYRSSQSHAHAPPTLRASRVAFVSMATSSASLETDALSIASLIKSASSATHAMTQRPLTWTET